MDDALINYGPITQTDDGQHPIFATVSSLCFIIVLRLIFALYISITY